MSLSKREAETIVALVPTAVRLTGQLVDLIKTLRDEGHEVPGLDDLRDLNSKLKALDDLEPDK